MILSSLPYKNMLLFQLLPDMIHHFDKINCHMVKLEEKKPTTLKSSWITNHSSHLETQICTNMPLPPIKWKSIFQTVSFHNLPFLKFWLGELKASLNSVYMLVLLKPWELFIICLVNNIPSQYVPFQFPSQVHVALPFTSTLHVPLFSQGLLTHGETERKEINVWTKGYIVKLRR